MLIAFQVLAQDVQSEFLEAKRLFRNGEFLEARAAFMSISDDDSFGPYAKYYAGYCSYELKDNKAAIVSFRQLLIENSFWEKIPEVYNWLITLNYQSGSFADALRYSADYSKKFDSTLPENLGITYLPKASLDQLKRLYEKYLDTPYLAKVLAQKINEQEGVNSELFEELVAKFNLKRSDYTGFSEPMLLKEKYAIAAFLPFMFDSLQNPAKTINNKVVMDMYQGMLLAEKEVNRESEKIQLFPFDTKRSKEVTHEILANETLKGCDLIIGPLFNGPNEVVSDYSLENKINMFNPVSSNLDVTRDNPYSYLLKPSFETMAKSLACHTAERIDRPNTLIYFSKNERDSLFAEAYRSVIEENGYSVIEFQSVDNNQSKTILDSLIVQHEELIRGKEEADSLLEIEGRFIKSRKVDSDKEVELDYLVISEEEETLGDSLIYYEMKYNVAEDSIGHILVASRDNGVVNNFIGAAETRPDNIGLVGYGNWLNFKVVDYNQIERLNVTLADADFVDKRKLNYQEFRDKVIMTYGSLPTQYHYVGYESVMYTSYMLTKYGKYFQNSFSKEGFTPGSLSSGFQYTIRNDNQFVPIITLKDNQLVPSVINEN